MSRGAEEIVGGVRAFGRVRVAVAVRLGVYGDGLLLDGCGCGFVASLLRAFLLGRTLQCFVDSAHHESPLLSQLRKARPRSSESGVFAPPPSISRSTSCS